MAQDEAYDVRVVGRRTDDQGRTLIQETFWYKGSFYMADRYERVDEPSEKKAVEDAVPSPPNPIEDEPVEATSAVEVPTLPVETRPAGCNLVETVTTAQPAMTQKAGTAPNANHTYRQTAEQTQQSDGPEADSSHRKPSAPSAADTDSAEDGSGRRNPLPHVQSARRAARGGLPAVALVGNTAHGQDDLAAAMLGCADPRGPATRPTCTQRSLGNCWIQRT
jgi:hypothetical protein